MAGFGHRRGQCRASWNRLDLRFPHSYWQIFQSVGDELKSILMSFCRGATGERALSEGALESGREGLMQLMPATRVAWPTSVKRYTAVPARSTTPRPTSLGATYYVDLLSRFEGNRVKALAAYNAGRVGWCAGQRKRWRWISGWTRYPSARRGVRPGRIGVSCHLPDESGTAGELVDRSRAEALYDERH